MPKAEQYDAVVIGSGEGGKYLAWNLAQAGQKTAVIERRWIGGSCPNINCLPSKNEIWSAGVARIVARAGEFGVKGLFRCFRCDQHLVGSSLKTAPSHQMWAVPEPEG